MALKTSPIATLLFLGVLIGILSGCSTEVPQGPLIAREQAWQDNPKYIIGNDQTLLKWMNAKAPESTVFNPQSRWPNGLAESMTPLLVDWEDSCLNNTNKVSQSNEYFIVHNAYVSGNPILGSARLATIRIPTKGVKTVEFLIVRYNIKGLLAKTGGHVQLRFIFDEAHRPELLRADGSLDPVQPYLDDLIVSWEAWRPTGETWNFKEGLDPTKYRLTARLYAGDQRFLQDALRGAVWDCYPLDLSVSADAPDAVLSTGLLMGDALGRHLIWDMLEKGLIKDPTEEVKKAWKKEDLQKAEKMFAEEGIPQHLEKIYFNELKPGYHALERSCINMALEQIDQTMKRIYKRDHLGSWTDIHVAPTTIPSWFDDVVEGKDWKAFFEAPYALTWLINHKEVLPYKAYLPLKKAGLLQLNKKGKIIFYRYNYKETSPYGPLREKIM